jgi:hypothetical protein
MLRAIAVLIVATSCTLTTSPIEPAMVRLQTERAAYAAGDTVHVSATNLGLEPISFSACSVELQKKQGARWGKVTHDWVCLSNLITLTPGGATSVWLDLPNTLGAGRYRFFFPELYNRDGNILSTSERVSNEFVID